MDEISQEPLSLLPPPHRKRAHQHRQRHLRRLPPVENRLDDIGRQQRQPQHPADIGSIDVLGCGDFLDGRKCWRALMLTGAMKIRTALNVGGLSLRFGRSIAEQNVNSALRLADRRVPLKVHGKEFTLFGPTYSRAWAIYSDSPSRRVLNNHKRIAAIPDVLSLHGCLSV